MPKLTATAKPSKKVSANRAAAPARPQTASPARPRKAATSKTVTGKTTIRRSPAKGKSSAVSSVSAAPRRKTASRTQSRLRTKRPVSAPLPLVATGDRTPAADEQARVVAAKFAATGVSPRPPLPALPSTYGENHLLLLVRDPQTVFAAWDIAPTAVEALKARIGRRGFAVSTLTLRLTSAGGAQTVYHVGKRRRSGYLRVAGGPSFVAEIGFTVPSGQFEFVARSAPCFIPLEGGSALPERAVRARVSYREAAALVRRGVPLSRPAKTEGVGSDETKDGPPASYPSPRDKPMSVTTGILGGASDLYRR